MPRKAREARPFGVYYVRQSRSEARPIFLNDADRLRFLEILKQAKARFGFKLYAYCLKDPEQYHLILHANGSDLSKLMKSINIAYAMYVDCEGKLFKDRYESTLLKDRSAFQEIKAQIDKRRCGDCFNGDMALCDVSDPFEDTCDTCIRSIEEGRERLAQIALSEHRDVSELIRDKLRRNDLILEFRRNSLLSLKDLGALFGGLSESSVCKILNR
ncbi:MAG: REP-associated tyrosine transposase [Clostridiales bacterium]|nr:REP-associated tyrosine transposase [Clostridiales bacterium]